MPEFICLPDDISIDSDESVIDFFDSESLCKAQSNDNSNSIDVKSNTTSDSNSINMLELENAIRAPTASALLTIDLWKTSVKKSPVSKCKICPAAVPFSPYFLNS